MTNCFFPYGHTTEADFLESAKAYPSMTRVCAHCNKEGAKKIIQTGVDISDRTAPLAIVCEDGHCADSIRYNMNADMEAAKSELCDAFHREVDVDELVRNSLTRTSDGTPRQLVDAAVDSLMPAAEPIAAATDASVKPDSSVPFAEKIGAHLLEESIGTGIDTPRVSRLATMSDFLKNKKEVGDFSDLYQQVLAIKKLSQVDRDLNNRAMFSSPILMVVPTKLGQSTANVEEKGAFLAGLYRLMFRIPFHFWVLLGSTPEYSFKTANGETIKLFLKNRDLYVQFSQNTISKSKGLLTGTDHKVSKIVSLINGTAILI